METAKSTHETSGTIKHRHLSHFKIAIIDPINYPLKNKLQLNLSETTEQTAEHPSNHNSLSSEIVIAVIADDSFKLCMLRYYKRKSFLFTNKVKCMVTNEWHVTSKYTACQLWKCTRQDMIHLFMCKDDLVSPRNGIIVLHHIAQKYYMKEICLVYDALACVFVIRVLNPAILDLPITNSKLKFRDIHGKILQHPPDRMPFRRLLAHHARHAYQHAVDCCWISIQEEGETKSCFELAEKASVAESEFYL